MPRTLPRLLVGLTLLAGLFAAATPSAAQVDGTCSTTLVVDAPSPGAVVTTSVLVRGWALDLATPDGSGVGQINLYLDGEPGSGRPLGAATRDQFRPDVDAVFARPSSQSGWSFAWNLAGISPGSHTLYVSAQDACGAGSIAVPVTVSAATITIDRPAAGATVPQGQVVAIGGWALDPAPTGGSGIDAVHLYLDGEAGAGPAIGAAAVGQPRPDVAAALARPGAANSGFSLESRLSSVLPGSHVLHVYAHSSQGWAYRSLPFTLVEAPVQRAPLPPGRLYPNGAAGFSISWPQCGEPIPPPPYQLALVGATGGRAFYQNPCLAAEFGWARAAAAAPGIYMNLNYPAGRAAPRAMMGPAGVCAAEDQQCRTHNYGYNAALHAVAYARSQGVAVPFWWLDIETENTWSEDQALNARVIQGAIDGLRAQGLGVGIYSTALQWREIAGSFNPGLPVWLAGAGSRAEAPRLCTPSAAFGGGSVVLVQYPNGSFAGEYAC